MSNKFYNKDTAPSKQSGGANPPSKQKGSGPNLSMPEKSANWPGIPGKGGPNRGPMQYPKKRGI